jgi:hypothetical protein
MNNVITKRPGDGLQDKLSDKEMANLLPIIAHAVTGFHERTENRGSPLYLLSTQARELTLLCHYFIDEEMIAADPEIRSSAGGRLRSCVPLLRVRCPMDKPSAAFIDLKQRVEDLMARAADPSVDMHARASARLTLEIIVGMGALEKARTQAIIIDIERLLDAPEQSAEAGGLTRAASACAVKRRATLHPVPYEGRQAVGYLSCWEATAVRCERAGAPEHPPRHPTVCSRFR